MIRPIYISSHCLALVCCYEEKRPTRVPRNRGTGVKRLWRCADRRCEECGAVAWHCLPHATPHARSRGGDTSTRYRAGSMRPVMVQTYSIGTSYKVLPNGIGMDQADYARLAGERANSLVHWLTWMNVPSRPALAGPFATPRFVNMCVLCASLMKLR